MKAKEIVTDYINALNKEDFSKARTLVTEDLLFDGVLGQRHGAAEYFADMEKMKLKYEVAQKRAPSFLLKFDPGAKYPYHNHPAGEELYVVSGSCIIENTTLHRGDYLYTPPGFKHSVQTETGCELFFMVPQEVEIL